ncbi:FAD-binding oxidoreductase [Xanthomonadaceae bacterium JHOS43]|nr:FAD-binding oxidoreductase [Xanthomonadaceae bacterium JHOS43]MCX7563239.1 FAD-binding oxidoreductase [Xanthomonadaceae bacterium XH05]
MTESIATPRTTEVAVIGSGVVGLSCAFHLREQRRDVLMIDPHGFGKQTSHGNAGSISTGDVLPQSTPGVLLTGLKMLFDADAPLKLDFGAWSSWLGWVMRFVYNGGSSRVLPFINAMHAINDASRASWIELSEAIDARELIAETGWLHVYSEEASFEKGEWERQLMRERGVSHQVLDARQLRDLEPGIGEMFRHAVFQDQALAMRDPGQFCKRLGDALLARGAHALRANVAQVLPGKGQYRIVTDQGTVHADKVVLAAGVWTNRLLRDLKVKVPVIPARGYHLMYPDQPGLVHRPTLWAERYMVLSPMLPGIRMTSIKELTAIGRDPDYRYIQRRDADARRLFPALAGQPVAEWAGYRPCTPDSLPIIDRVGDHDVYVATGHGHFGLTQAPTTGKLIVQMMSGSAPLIPLEPYRLSRF